MELNAKHHNGIPYLEAFMDSLDKSKDVDGQEGTFAAILEKFIFACLLYHYS